MKNQNEIAKWTREDKRETHNKHTIITSTRDNKKHYELMGTLDEEESKKLLVQLGIGLQGKIILGEGVFGKVRLVRNIEGIFFAVKKIKPNNKQNSSHFDAEALKREEQFNGILLEKNISGVMKIIDVFSTTDHKDNPVMFQIMPIANLREGANFMKLYSLLASDISEGKLELPNDLLQQLKFFDSQIDANNYTNDNKTIDNKNDNKPLEHSTEEKRDDELLESSDDEEDDADLLESSDDEKGDADLLKISESEDEDAHAEELSTKSQVKPSELLMKFTMLHITQSLVKTLNEMHQNGIYHRDIHLKNILFDSKGQIYLSDFGTGIAYDHGKIIVEVTSKLQPAPLPPETKFPTDMDLKKHFIKGSQKSQESVDEWELGCTLISFMGAESSDLIKKLQMRENEIKKTHFAGKGSQYENYMAYLSRELDKFDAKVLKPSAHPMVREVILGLLNPDFNKRMSLTQTANLMNKVQLPVNEATSKIFNLLAPYQAKQEKTPHNQSRFFKDGNNKEGETTIPPISNVMPT